VVVFDDEWKLLKEKEQEQIRLEREKRAVNKLKIRKETQTNLLKR
jgi:hypothetical protein